MSFNVAYSDKNKIKNSIAQGIISQETFIMTNNEEKDAEAYYYDEKGNLKQLVKKIRFDSETEARTWIAKYNGYEGETISVKDKDGNWLNYAVGNNNKMTLIPNVDDLTSILDGLIIDGGGAPSV